MRAVAVTLLVGMTVFTAASWARQPSGEGDPAETRCMRSEDVTGTKMGKPMVCKTNAEWAQLKKDGVILNPDGSVFEPDKDPRKAGAHGCTAAPGGISNAGNMGATSRGFDCH